MTTKAVHVRDVSMELWNQLGIEAEAASVTRRVWVLRALRRECGLPEHGEIERGMGRPTDRQREELEQEALRRQAVEQRIQEIERQPAICGPVHRGGMAFVCKLKPGHDGECTPDPLPSEPSLTGV